MKKKFKKLNHELFNDAAMKREKLKAIRGGLRSTFTTCTQGHQVMMDKVNDELEY